MLPVLTHVVPLYNEAPDKAHSLIKNAISIADSTVGIIETHRIVLSALRSDRTLCSIIKSYEWRPPEFAGRPYADGKQYIISNDIEESDLMPFYGKTGLIFASMWLITGRVLITCRELNSVEYNKILNAVNMEFSGRYTMALAKKGLFGFAFESCLLASEGSLQYYIKGYRRARQSDEIARLIEAIKLGCPRQSVLRV
jgi:hypothetical protein